MFVRVASASFAVVAILFVVVSWQGTISDRIACSMSMCPDNVYYSRMSQHVAVPAPFAYRVLTPWLAGFVPGSFGTITFLGLGVFFVSLYYVQAELGVVAPLRYFGVAMAAGSFWVAEFFVIDKGLVDALSMAALGVGTWASLKQRWSLGLWMLVIGVLNKEVGIVLLGPLVVGAYNSRRFDVVSAALLLGAAAIALPRFVLDANGSSYGVGASWPGSFGDLMRDARSLTWNMWGLLFPLALLAHPRFLFAHAGLVAMLFGVYLQLPFATDTARLLAPGAIVLVPVAMLGVQRLGVRSGGQAMALATVAVGLQIFIFHGQRTDLHRLIDALQPNAAAITAGRSRVALSEFHHIGHAIALPDGRSWAGLRTATMDTITHGVTLATPHLRAQRFGRAS